MRWTSKSRARWEAFLGRMARMLCGGGGLTLGSGFQCSKIPYFLVNPGCSIEIGKNVLMRGDVEIRATGTSKIVIEDNVRIDRGVRILSANDALVRVGEGSIIGHSSVINGGDSVTLGRKCLLAGFVYVQASMHRHEAGTFIRDQGHDHAPIRIRDDVWLGAHSVVMPGCELANGVIVGSNAVVTKSLPENAIVVGIPAKVVKNREAADTDG